MVPCIIFHLHDADETLMDTWSDLVNCNLFDPLSPIWYTAPVLYNEVETSPDRKGYIGPNGRDSVIFGITAITKKC